MNRDFDIATGKDLYSSERGKQDFDLTKMRFLHTGIDTIRQLYNCSIKADVLSQIAHHYENNNTDVIEIEGIPFKLSSSGKKSGYKYILKNLELGYVVLLKSFY
jgi:hypothetical protein